VEELVQLKEAGLSRLHVGLESGSDEVLKFMNKGVTAQQHIEAGQRVKASGISLPNMYYWVWVAVDGLMNIPLRQPEC
jgi:radical SAM superfamily enzyme YgiQ (UPF0313 family)